LLKPLRFSYPLEGASSILVKLGVKAENGVGPDGDIVAFSVICQHQGCFFDFFNPPRTVTSATTTEEFPPEGHCGCHGSIYDLAHDGKVIVGPASYPVPRVLLEYDQATGDIYVTGMGPPTIFGYGPLGTTDPAEVLKYDLQGGQVVTQINLTPF
jgi:arsenite oxidase small subunit